MKIIVLADLKIQITSREDTKNVQVVTPKGRVINFSNVPPTTFEYTVKGFFGKTKTKSIPVELKTRVTEFLEYTWDKRSNKQYIETKELDQYPLWPCVKWNFSGQDGIYMFNFVRQTILLYPKASKETTMIPNGIKINMRGVLELEQDLLERVLEVDSLQIWSGHSVPVPIQKVQSETPPPYDDVTKASEARNPNAGPSAPVCPVVK